MGDVTGIINSLRRGEPGDGDAFPIAVYEDLRRMAIQRMRNESPAHTLQPTALVHEAWLRLCDAGAGKPFENRRHFFGAAGEAMRRILVDSARRRMRPKHGGHLVRADAEIADLPSALPDDEVLALHEALDRLAAVHAEAADVVKLRYFVGFTQVETAEALEISVSSVERLWAFARAWLYREIGASSESSAP